MRRALIAAAAALLILSSALAAVFVFSEFRSRSQRPLHEAFSDFVFVLDTGARQVFGFPFPALDASAYESAMGHARQGAHRAVADGIVLRLERWGQPALPRLARELERAEAAAAARDYSRIYTAVQGIGAIGGPEAARIVADWLSAEDRLARLAEPSMGGGLLSRLVSALGKMHDPRATALLIEIERRRYATQAGGGVLNAIGRSRTPHAAEFLLERYAAARSEAEIDALIWPLAFTHDARAGAVLAELRVHRAERLRYAAMSAVNQERGPHLLAAYLGLLDAPVGDRIHAEALGIIAHPANRGDARALAAAARNLDHPYLARQARYALLALLDERSMPAYRDALRIIEPADMGIALRNLGAAALPFAEALIASSAKASHRATVVRHIAIQKVLEGRALLERLVADPDPEIRAAARWSLARLDKMALLRDFLGYLPDDIAAVAWRNIQGGEDEDAVLADYSYGRGFEAVWNVFTVVHAAGTVLAAWLGLMLVFNAIRVFQPYRFNLFIQFLLVEGFVGDFFLMDFGPRPDLTYLAATTAHLLLAIGMLCKERERVPGAARNRFERLGGASLWLLAPLLLYFGAPPLAQALRSALSGFHYFAAFFALACVLGLLVLEQAVVSLSLFFRSARAERVLVLLLSVAVCALIAGALLHGAELRDAAGERDAHAFAYLLLAPLVWMLALHAGSLGLLRKPELVPTLAPAPTRRMNVIQDGETVTVWFTPRRTAASTALALVLKWSFVLAVAGVAGYYAGRAGGLPAIIVALVAALAGAVLAALLLQALGACVLVQIRNGYARCANTTLGGVFGRAPWSRSIAFPTRVRRWLASHRGDGPAEAPLQASESAWLQEAMAAGSDAAEGQPQPAAGGTPLQITRAGEQPAPSVVALGRRA